MNIFEDYWNLIKDDKSFSREENLKALLFLLLLNNYPTNLSEEVIFERLSFIENLTIKEVKSVLLKLHKEGYGIYEIIKTPSDSQNYYILHEEMLIKSHS
jgi:hypothetical protein